MGDQALFFVTGANGFTGSNVVKNLVTRGHKVKGLVRQKSELTRLSGIPVELIRADIADEATLTTAFQSVDTVIHTAAMVELGITDGRVMERVNVEGTRSVVSAAKSAGVRRLIHCSTIGVLGDTHGTIANEATVRSSAPFASAYDRSKFQAEELALGANGGGLEVVSVLPSGIMGPGDPHFGTLIRLYQKGRLPFWPALDRLTGIVHVEDIAELLVLAGLHGSPGDRYIGSAGETTPRKIFEILGAILGRAPPRELPESAARTAAAVLDPIGRATGWNPPLSRERIHYLYDRCVRVKADKARTDLGWRPQAPEQVIAQLLG